MGPPRPFHHTYPTFAAISILGLVLICIFSTADTQSARDRSRATQIKAIDRRHSLNRWSDQWTPSSQHHVRIPVVQRGDIEVDDLTDTDSNIHPLSQAAYWHRRGGHGHPAPHPCEQSSCYPATGNLLIGRDDRLSATSTCGLTKQERYCIVSHLEDRKKCFWCDSRIRDSPAKSHRIENIIFFKEYRGTGQRTWWQSENGVENVTIQLDLEAEFHFTHLIITFKTFRPAAMLIERSSNFGKDWQVYRYFAHNCAESFPNIPEREQRSLTDVVCESRYSNVAPSTDGEVIFRVLPPNLHINDPYSNEVQNLLKMTNLRIKFIKLHTLGDDLLDNREEIQEKYYYAINEMIVRGSCSCYGHASRCLPLPNVPHQPDMIHGRCECTHNTKGLNCELCEDFYNDLPWKPAIGKQSNACKRCECNNHASSCHFDAAVYEQTGKVSGGVCDGCQHFTMGRNCEQCMASYYHDPTRDITDPQACQLCDCDPRGSLDEGICDSRTDEVNGLTSGRCHCKTNVDGRRCDRCKNGFWNFDENNPDGCQSCTCNTLGTIDNQGCNVYTGECTCKRYVTGRDCNQCLPEYWGLSDDRDGCKACDCDPGGSYDNSCDVITGQCRCRPHVTGRTCNQPEQSYFTGMLDYLVYEAELARGSQDCQVVIREPYRDGRENTWTGTGFMRAFQGSELEFDINDIQTPMEYDIVIRYERQMPATWENVRVIVERSEPVDRNGPCANSRPQDDFKATSLPLSQRSIAVYPPVCLEQGKPYKIKLQFTQYRSNDDTPSPSVLVDSIALIPRIESIPFFHDPKTSDWQLQEFERYQCAQVFYSVVKGPIPEVCKKYLYSVSNYVNNGAYACECDPTGSISGLCDTLGGLCQCKPNVVGRRCDGCAPGTYGFGPEGCKACDCNSIGALDNFCDPVNGQCKCRPNTYGRECNQCQPGFWNFPNCQRCDCHGHADICDSKTGACLKCRDYTYGHNCDRCIEGFYGEPRIGIDIPCRPCPCPGTLDSGHSYADRCVLDARTQDVVCECSAGYAGARCDVCADNYYGNPETPGGSCQECNCSNNIDVSRPGNCDLHTGKCLNCLFNTEGFNCHVCMAGFFGDALNQNCKPCSCGVLGVDASAGPCDRLSGQCHCLPNVIGKSCDQCADNHWKIASGQGCVPCDCDVVGSRTDQCNVYDGQCECNPGFGGRQCNQCTANHWGNPTVQCHACNCNPDGSAIQQCHRENGTCVCKEGIGGDKCDTCARGYLGNAPYCSSCGECFDNWDRILNIHREETERMIEAASEIKQTGATGAYTHEFEMMENKLAEVKQLLDNTTVSSNDLVDLENTVTHLRDKLTRSTKALESVDDILYNTTQGITLINVSLSNLHEKASAFKAKESALKKNATKLQETNVEGALNLTREARERSRKAQEQMDATNEIIVNSERQCRRTESLLNRTANQFGGGQEDNIQSLAQLSERLKLLETRIPHLNELVCDKRGDPCDALCGGAGCGVCGGLSCENGAATKAERALGYAVDAEKTMREKEAKAEELLRGISQAKQETVEALVLAQEAHDKANLAYNQSNDMAQRGADIANKMEEFSRTPGATPVEIRDRAEETLAKDIHLQPQQITDLAKAIYDTISSLKDVDEILNDTSNDLALANALKEQADRAKTDAEGVLDTAKRVVSALSEAKEAQGKAEDAISKANDDISAAEKDLSQIASETSDAQQKADTTVEKVESLQVRLRHLKTRLLKNGQDAKEVGDEAQKVGDVATKAKNHSVDLGNTYHNASNMLVERAKLSGEARGKAKKLLDRASKLFIGTNEKLRELEGMQNDYGSHEKMLNDLSKIIDDLNNRMIVSLDGISSRSEDYRTCVS